MSVLRIILTSGFLLSVVAMTRLTCLSVWLLCHDCSSYVWLPRLRWRSGQSGRHDYFVTDHISAFPCVQENQSEGIHRADLCAFGSLQPAAGGQAAGSRPACSRSLQQGCGSDVRLGVGLREETEASCRGHGKIGHPQAPLQTDGDFIPPPHLPPFLSPVYGYLRLLPHIGASHDFFP